MMLLLSKKRKLQIQVLNLTLSSLHFLVCGNNKKKIHDLTTKGL